MKKLHNNTTTLAALSLLLIGIISFSSPALAQERSRWDVKSFPRVPTGEKLSAEIENFQLPHSPEEGKALVYVVRPGIFFGLVRFGVYIDGKDVSLKVGHNRTRQYIHFNLEPGDHTIYSKASNWSEIDVTVKAGETIVLEQESNAFASNFLLQLSDDEGRYRIKKARPGTIL